MERLNEWFKTGQISLVTYELLKRLIKKYREKESYKTKFYWSSLSLLLFVGITLYHVFDGLRSPANLLVNVRTLFADSFLFFLLLLIVIAFVCWKFYNGKYKETDKKFENLRKEMIDRTQELWLYHEDKDVKVQVYQWLDQEFDINLFHK